MTKAFMRPLLLALLLGSALTQAGPARSGSFQPDPPLLAEATRELGLLHSSVYRHRTSVNEAAGRFDYDCSGFIDYALRRIAPKAYAELGVQRASSPRPLAQDYYALFARPHPPSLSWESVPTVQALRPGHRFDRHPARPGFQRAGRARSERAGERHDRGARRHAGLSVGLPMERGRVGPGRSSAHRFRTAAGGKLGA